MQAAFFGVIAFLSILSAILMVMNRNPVRSALFLVANFALLAVLYLTLAAQFIAAVEIIVYAGAIMVLFLFVLMLLSLGAARALRETGGLQPLVAIILGLIFLATLSAAGVLGTLGPDRATPQWVNTGGTVKAIGTALFDPRQPWLFPFEVTSILLLVAVVGAIVMAKRRI